MTIRVPDRLREDLARQARERGMEASSLARQYIEEGLIMDRYPLLRFWQRPGGRDLMLAGHRINVQQIVQMVQGSSSIERAAENLNLQPHHVMAAVEYYEDHKEQVDAWIREDLEYAERAYAEWLQGQALLTK